MKQLYINGLFGSDGRYSLEDAQLIAAAPKLLAACEHGAMSCHHPSCSHGKMADGNTCECHVKKCQEAIANARPTA